MIPSYIVLRLFSFFVFCFLVLSLLFSFFFFLLCLFLVSFFLLSFPCSRMWHRADARDRYWWKWVGDKELQVFRNGEEWVVRVDWLPFKTPDHEHHLSISLSADLRPVFHRPVSNLTVQFSTELWDCLAACERKDPRPRGYDVHHRGPGRLRTLDNREGSLHLKRHGPHVGGHNSERRRGVRRPW